MAELPKNAAAPKLPMSLYPELLQAERATISAAPVRYDPEQQKADEEAKKKKKDASLQFQPIKRPQPQQKKKPPPKPGFPSSSSSSSHQPSSSVNNASASSPPKSVLGSTPSVQRSTFDDWVAAAEDDDEFYYHDRPRAQRGGKNRKKKNKGQEVRTWDWDDIYDPSRPNVYSDYKGSEEQHREVKDWKARLYHRQLKEIRKASRGRDEEDREDSRPPNRMFAPPSQQMSFAPPTFDDAPPPHPMDEDDDDDYYSPAGNGRRDTNSPAPAFSNSAPDDASGEDAYFRRMRMGDVTSDQPPPVSSSPQTLMAPPLPPTAPSPAVSSQPAVKSQEALKAEALAKIAAFKAKYMKPTAAGETQQAPDPPANPAPSVQVEVQPPPPPPPPPPSQKPGVVISREPVRYKTSDGQDPSDRVNDEGGSKPLLDSQSDTQQPQSNRPSKKGFAERLLKKYGWEKGQGLGAQGEGITTALIGKADKRKKRSDAEGGGWAAPANMGKIVGGKRRKIDEDSNSNDHTSDLSSVIRLQGMLKGLDVQKEIEDNNLMQEIGDEMGNNYGNVERVFIWREEQGGANDVFVKFTSQLSALRAKDAMDGTTFADNEVQAAFWDEEKFERGEYGN